MLTSSILMVALNSGGDCRTLERTTLDGMDAVRIEGRANTTVRGTQRQATLSIMSDGSFAVAWEATRQNAGLSCALVRTFGPSGRPDGSERSLTSDGAHSHFGPSVVLSPKGKLFASYQSRLRDGRDRSAYVGEDRITGQPIGVSGDVVVAGMPDGRSVSVYTVEVAHEMPRVFARFYDAGGNAQGPEIRLSSFTSGSDSMPTVVASTSGYTVVWQHADSKGNPNGLFAQKLLADGGALGPNTQVAGADAIEPSLSACGDGLVLAWSQMVGSRFAARATKLNANLERNGETIFVQGSPYDQVAVQAAGRADGKFALVWNRRTSEDTDVVGQLFDNDGKPLAPSFVVTKSMLGNQEMAQGTGAQRAFWGKDGLTVVWGGNGGLLDNNGVYFTKIVTGLDADALDEAKIAADATARMVATAQAETRQFELKVEQVKIEMAGPHEPPVSDFLKAENGWGVEMPSSTGGFNAYSQTSFTPPDMNIAVGQDHVVVTVNDGIAFYTKDGTQTFMTNMRLTNGFWGSLAAPDDFIYDPECFYDTLTGRYWVMATQGAGSSADSAALVAVSDDGDPNGTWFKYRFLATSQAGNFFDSPNFGVDENVLYVTGDGFGLGANYPIFTFEKAPMLTGGMPGVTRSLTLPTSTQSAGIPQVQSGQSAWYMVEHKEAGSNTGIDLVALRSPLGTPTTSRFTLSVPSYGGPEDPPQSGSTSRVDTFDARMWSVKFRNGRIWASHHVNNSRVRARWYEIDPRGWPTSGNNPVVVQSGEVDLGGTLRTFFPAIAVDDQGNMAVAYGRSSPTEFYSGAHSYRNPADAAGTTKGHTIDVSSAAAYSGGRWGDYSGCDADAKYPGLFWGFTEWHQSNSWRAWAQPFYVTNELWPKSFDTSFGRRIAGDVSSLINEDGNFLTHQTFIRTNVTDPHIRYDLRTFTCRRNQTSANLRLVYRVDAAGYFIKTELLNHTTGQYDQIDQRQASVAVTTLNLAVANPTNYVRASDGLVSYRVTILQGTGPVGSPTVRLFADRWAWVEN